MVARLRWAKVKHAHAHGITLVSVLLSSSAWALGAVLRAAHIKCPSRGAETRGNSTLPPNDDICYLLDFPIPGMEEEYLYGIFGISQKRKRSSPCYIEIHLVESTAAAFFPSSTVFPLSQRSSGMCLVLKKMFYIENALSKKRKKEG